MGDEGRRRVSLGEGEVERALLAALGVLGVPEDDGDRVAAALAVLQAWWLRRLLETGTERVTVERIAAWIAGQARDQLPPPGGASPPRGG